MTQKLKGKIKALNLPNYIDIPNGDNVSKEVKALLQQKYNSVFQPRIGKLKDFTAQISQLTEVYETRKHPACTKGKSKEGIGTITKI